MAARASLSASSGRSQSSTTFSASMIWLLMFTSPFKEQVQQHQDRYADHQCRQWVSVNKKGAQQDAPKSCGLEPHQGQHQHERHECFFQTDLLSIDGQHREQYQAKNDPIKQLHPVDSTGDHGRPLKQTQRYSMSAQRKDA